MTEQALITFTSDFGLRDGYVGIIKGVIAGIAPHARTIDLNHQISPQDLYAGRFILLNAYQYFPQGTIHRKFGSETPSFYDGFTVKYEHRLRNIC